MNFHREAPKSTASLTRYPTKILDLSFCKSNTCTTMMYDTNSQPDYSEMTRSEEFIVAKRTDASIASMKQQHYPNPRKSRRHKSLVLRKGFSCLAGAALNKTESIFSSIASAAASPFAADNHSVPSTDTIDSDYSDQTSAIQKVTDDILEKIEQQNELKIQLLTAIEKDKKLVRARSDANSKCGLGVILALNNMKKHQSQYQHCRDKTSNLNDLLDSIEMDENSASTAEYEKKVLSILNSVTSLHCFPLHDLSDNDVAAIMEEINTVLGRLDL